MNKNKLLGKIKENGYTIKDVAALTGIKLSTLSRKINAHAEFSRDELDALSETLKMTDAEFLAIFFESKVS